MPKGSAKPMLASPIEFQRVQYPLHVQPKLDGIRAIRRNDALYSRSMKTIPNNFVQRWSMNLEAMPGLDGELVVGPPNAKDVFAKTTSGIMSHSGTPDFSFMVFDLWDDGLPYLGRRRKLEAWFASMAANHTATRMILVPERVCNNEAEVTKALEDFMAEGYEGLIARSPDTYYKYGRSTAKELALLKWKVWIDEEAEVVGFEELQHNENEAFTSETGHTKRSSHQAGKVGGQTLGALVVKSHYPGTFNVGSGFDAALRKLIWDNKDQYLGKLVKFKHFPHGQVDLPRHPIFLGFRDKDDM